MNFSQQRERGRVYEMAFERWLQTQGWYTLAAYDYSGKADDKAPSLVCGKTGLVTPDILAMQLTKKAWFEIKLKTHADLHRKTGNLVTGLPLRHWHHYHDVKTLTDMPVWLVFIHEQEQAVVTGEISDMPVNHIYGDQLMDRGGTIFFIFEQLRPIITLNDLHKFIKD